MSFGSRIRVEWNGFGINMQPVTMADIPELSRGFSSARVLRLTHLLYRGRTEEDERDWIEKTRKDPDSLIWGIFPDGSDGPKGTCGLDGIDHAGSCTAGIVIWDPEWWGRGIASRAHIGMVYAAAFLLNRNTIKAQVRVPNEPSWRAAVRVGYILAGLELRTVQVEEEFLDTFHLTWLNPGRIGILYPKGLPSEHPEYEEGVENARLALAKARKVVELL